MSEPHPPDADDEQAVQPANAEDRKAAAALSALDKRGDDDDDAHTTTTQSAADQKALGEAMSRLELAETKHGAGTAAGGKGTAAAGGAAAAAEAEAKEGAKKKVKVEMADVALLVEELELSKGKATELLKAHEGNAVEAMRAFVRASA